MSDSDQDALERVLREYEREHSVELGGSSSSSSSAGASGTETLSADVSSFESISSLPPLRLGPTFVRAGWTGSFDDVAVRGIPLGRGIPSGPAGSEKGGGGGGGGQGQTPRAHLHAKSRAQGQGHGHGQGQGGVSRSIESLLIEQEQFQKEVSKFLSKSRKISSRIASLPDVT